MKSILMLLRSRTLYGTIAVLIFWYLMHAAVRSNIIPGPAETIAAFAGLLTGSLLLHILSSLFRIIAAVAVSMIIGIPLGLWIGESRRADAIVTPVAYILYPIPKIAFLPVFMLLFGLGDSAKIILIITIIIFQIILAARDGVKEIPLELLYSVRSLGLSRLQTYIHLVLPAVLPKIVSALRISIGVSIAALFFAENFATRYGIGYFIMNSWIMVDYVQMFAGILALSIMGILVFKVIDLLERKLCPWIFLNEPGER